MEPIENDGAGESATFDRQVFSTLVFNCASMLDESFRLFVGWLLNRIRMFGLTQVDDLNSGMMVVLRDIDSTALS